MEHQIVYSSMINSIGYDPNTSEMEVEFNDGTTVTYSDVPKYIYNEFISSTSKGKFFHQNIKDIYDYN